MFDRISYIFNYLIYFFTSDTKYDVHSPFVYNFVVNTINSRKQKPFYHSIELIRTKMLKSQALIKVKALGAKAHEGDKTLTLGQLCRRTSKSAKYAELLERICAYQNPQIAIEIGTSLGISTLYQAMSINNGWLISLEGNPESIKVAQHNAEQLELRNIQFIEGDFNSTLPEVVKQLETIDYVFFDGNHTYEATIQYFEWCLTKANQNTIFIFDDIRWSADMFQAWNKVIDHQHVTVSIDLFAMGLVFFRTGQEKQHFTIRY